MFILLILLRYGITKTIDYSKHFENLTIVQKSKFLKRDIDNGPYHVFGYHDKCNPSVKNMLKMYKH